MFRQSGEIEVVNRPHHLHCQSSHRRPLRFHPIRWEPRLSLLPVHFLMSFILCTPLSWTPFPCLNSIIWFRPPYFFRYLHPHVDIFRMPYLGTARPKERTCQPWGTLFQYRLGENRSRNPCCSDCWQGSPILEYWYEHSKCEYLLCTPDGGHFIYRNYYDSYWSSLVEVLNIDHTPHCTRHTCISMLTVAGVDDKVIKKIAGHKGQSATEVVYTHFEIEELSDAINKIWQQAGSSLPVVCSHIIPYRLTLSHKRFYPWILCPLMVYYKYKKTTAHKVGWPNEW